MADKLLFDVTKFGTVKDNELAIEVDDSRGREGDKPVNRLFPTSAGGGGQTSQIVFVNRYRPGNRYKYVRLNGTIVQYSAVVFDLTVTEPERDGNVIVLPDTPGVAFQGILEFGNGGPLASDPALQSHAAGIFGFITTFGKAIANVNAAVAAGDFLSSGGGAAGRLVTVAAAGAAYAQAVAQGTQAAAHGVGARALVTEPPTLPSAWKANLTWIFMR